MNQARYAERQPAGDWAELGNCYGLDPEFMFPGKDPAAIAEAKAVCVGCVVRGECLALALANRETEGVWGGFDFDEREGMRR